MKHHLAIVLALAAGVVLAQAPDRAPKRTPGLWEMKTSLAQMGGLGMTFQTCIDQSIDDLMVQPDRDDTRCTDQSYRRDGDRVLFQATCQAEGSVARIRGAFTGDFARAYRGEVNTTFTPPLHGMAATDMTLDARWLGACQPGQKPGDVVVQGMPAIPGIPGSFNVEEMLKNMPARPKP
jgi:hypothetical protein